MFVWISQQTMIISLCSINWFVFITAMECAYCAVPTESLYIIQVNLSLWRFNFVQRSCLWTPTKLCEAPFPLDSRTVYSAHYIVSVAQPWNPMVSPCNVWARARGPLDEAGPLPVFDLASHVPTQFLYLVFRFVEHNTFLSVICQRATWRDMTKERHTLRFWYLFRQTYCQSKQFAKISPNVSTWQNLCSRHLRPLPCRS